MQLRPCRAATPWPLSLSTSPLCIPLNTPIALALGSNLGDSRAILRQALCSLAQTPGVTLRCVSSWYETVPIGGPPQPDIINGCALLQTSLEPLAYLRLLQSLEQQAGRVRSVPWGPRTLDLDLLWFGARVLNTPELTLPHPRLHERAFVLVPLAEIAPDWIHPVLQTSIAALAAQVDVSGVKRKLEVC